MSSLKNILLASTMLLSFGAFASDGREELSDASEQGMQYCSMKPEIVEHFAPGIDADRENLITMFKKKWVNGTRLTYYFFDEESDGLFLKNKDGEFVLDEDGEKIWKSFQGEPSEKDVVRKAFDEWKSVGIGLSFLEVNDRKDANIRIGFMRGNGAWSYVGRDILGKSRNARTMNFGWVDADTALHEIGHTLGFPHEHQNPLAGIKWDEDKVYAELAKEPNKWSKEKTFHNIIRKIKEDDVQGTSWDKDSIMHYPFKAGMILEPAEYKIKPLKPAPGLSSRDKDWVRRFYPDITGGDESDLQFFLGTGKTEVTIQNGDNLIFTIRLPDSGKYQIETLGDLDTVMVLFDDAGIKIGSDDDSGHSFNSKIQATLLQDHDYKLSLRLYYKSNPGPFNIMMNKI